MRYVTSVHSSFAFILMGKRELVDLLSLSSWCLVTVVWLFLTVPRVCLRFVVVVFTDHTHIIFLMLSIFCSNVDHNTDWLSLNLCLNFICSQSIN